MRVFKRLISSSKCSCEINYNQFMVSKASANKFSFIQIQRNGNIFLAVFQNKLSC